MHFKTRDHAITYRVKNGVQEARASQSAQEAFGYMVRRPKTEYGGTFP